MLTDRQSPDLDRGVIRARIYPAGKRHEQAEHREPVICFAGRVPHSVSHGIDVDRTDSRDRPMSVFASDHVEIAALVRLRGWCVAEKFRTLAIGHNQRRKRAHLWPCPLLFHL